LAEIFFVHISNVSSERIGGTKHFVN